jgi:DNA-binding NarL/FixJ family response regulator
MKKHPVSVLLADDHDVVRAGLRAILETYQNWRVCAEATNGNEAIKLTAELQPDIVVLDLEMKDMDGLSVTRRIKEHDSDVEVLIFTMHDNEWLIREVLAAGAKAYVLKSEGVGPLIKAIECAVEHKTFLPPKASKTLLNRIRTSMSKSDESSPLTSRERAIVQLLASGRSNKEAAVALGISVKTIETHRAAIMRKLGFSSIVSLVRYAVREHFIKA